MELQLALAAIGMLDALVPKIAEMFRNGEITDAEQAKVRDAYESLKTKANNEFSGPEWEVR